MISTSAHLIKREVIYSVNIGKMQMSRTQLGKDLTIKQIYPSLIQIDSIVSRDSHTPSREVNAHILHE